jgi:hypothetical protein
MLRNILVVVLVLGGCFFSSKKSHAFLKDFLPSQKLYVPQNGMYPNIPAGSQFRCKNYAYSNVSDVQYGDVIAFRHKWKGKKTYFVWRVVALPGDRIVVDGQSVIYKQQNS